MNYLLTTVISSLIVLASLFGYSHTDNFKESVMESVQLSAFQPTGGLTYRLQSSIGTTNTTITLSSLKNRSDIPLTMTVLGTDIGYGTLSPQTSRSEFISFTGITQNANGTAQLTGVTRGLSDVFPFVASTTLRESHPGQSVFILSDSPALFDEYTKRRSNESISAQWGFTVNATSTTDCSASTEYCRKAYVDAIAITGSATTTETTTGGNIRLTQNSLVGTNQASSSSGAPLVLTNRDASATYNRASTSQIVVTGSTNTIDSNFIATSSAYTWSGNNTHSGTNTFSATTSINAKLAVSTSTPSLGVNLAVSGGALISGTTTVGNLVLASSSPNYSGLFIRATSTVITATSTWTVPTGVTRVKVRLVGGGGGAGGCGGSCSADSQVGGGGGGAYAEALVDVTGLSSVTVNIGVGGVGNTVSGDGNAGGNTSFAGNTTITAAGGAGSTGLDSGGAGTAGGTGGTCTNANFCIDGQDGETGAAGSSMAAGGSSFMGLGGRRKPAGTGNGENGKTYGGGGGGADGTNNNGGTGANGVAIIEWYE